MPVEVAPDRPPSPLPPPFSVPPIARSGIVGDPRSVSSAPATVTPVALPLHWQRTEPGAAPLPPAGDTPPPAIPGSPPPPALMATRALMAAPDPAAPTAPPATTGPRRPAEATADRPLPPAPPPSPVFLVQPASSAPAAIVFGAARFAAPTADDRDDPAFPLGASPLTASPLAAPATIDRVATVAPATTPPFDMRQERWPQAMIERIETIRDAADALDTRIRLVPDALGAIDVNVQRDGDTLHVRFTAEQAQTRALLADAAPRLAEAAESRGLRLGQSGVNADAGTTGQGGGHRQPLPAAAPPRAPLSAPTPAATDHGAGDTRLA